MDLYEATQRIFRAHVALIVVCLLAGLGVGFAVVREDARTYTASARLAVGSTVPKSEAESAALASTARGIVTSQARVAAAIQREHVARNPNQVATNHVFTRALGSSGILELSVSDTNPRVAARLTNALADDLQQTWLKLGHGQAPGVIADLNVRLAKLNQMIGDLDARIDAAPGATLKDQADLRASLARREDLSRQAVALESQRDRVVSQDAVDTQASVISRATAPSGADSSRLPQSLALGGLIGLILGVGGAALLETLHPTLVGRRLVARTAGVSLLGHLPAPPDRVSADAPEVLMVASRLRLAANAARVHDVELVPTRLSDLTTLADSLEGALATTPVSTNGASKRVNGGALGAGQRGKEWSDAVGGKLESMPGAVATKAPPENPRLANQQPLTVHAFGRALDAHNPRDAAMIVVAPSRLKQRELDAALDVGTIAGWSTLGIVTYQPLSRPARLASWVTRKLHGSGESQPQLVEPTTT